MANRKQLKGVNKNRHSSKAGTRRRGRCKKSVFEKRRLRILANDTLLNENFNTQQSKMDICNYRFMEG